MDVICAHTLAALGMWGDVISRYPDHQGAGELCGDYYECATFRQCRSYRNIPADLGTCEYWGCKMDRELLRSGHARAMMGYWGQLRGEYLRDIIRINHHAVTEAINPGNDQLVLTFWCEPRHVHELQTRFADDSYSVWIQTADGAWSAGHGSHYGNERGVRFLRPYDLALAAEFGDVCDGASAFFIAHCVYVQILDHQPSRLTLYTDLALALERSALAPCTNWQPPRRSQRVHINLLADAVLVALETGGDVAHHNAELSSEIVRLEYDER